MEVAASSERMEHYEVALHLEGTASYVVVVLWEEMESCQVVEYY